MLTVSRLNHIRAVLNLASQLQYSFSVLATPIIHPPHHFIHQCSHMSQTCGYDLKQSAATPSPADVLAGSTGRVNGITQLAGVTKEAAGPTQYLSTPEQRQ
ncbi:Hypothetical predicted protein [Xyrichtys novacula]|uniref:Uncharacterized protein n=1 Tax=Xyrichtys novacula TaxID=13765 RepID=A0AAV1FDI2_XYRNO|nr:Hypothetical predicted protein [Xyrichtys novacula]